MPKAIFIFKNDLKPSLEDLVYEVDGERKGGFTLLLSPDDINMYWVDTSPEKIKAMKADTENYKWLKDVEEDQVS